MTDGDNDGFTVQVDVRAPWRRYLDDLAPLRPELYAFCVKLTGSPWEAEDLAQDALLKVFSMLGKMDADIRHPKAYLIRTATNLWVDAVRRSAREQAEIELASDEEADNPEQGARASEAAQTLLADLYPQERAALVMKDVLGYSLEEVGAALQTTPGAIKSALHRARARLGQRRAPAGFLPDKGLVESFMQALATTDLDTLKSICAADLNVELVGGAELNSFEQSSNFFAHAHFVMPEIGFGENPNWRLVEYEGEAIVLGLRTLDGVEGLNEIHRLETSNGKITRIRCYCFCPDTLREVAPLYGLEALARPYRSPDPGEYAS